MFKKLPRKFYYQPTLKVAQQLLGKYLVRQNGQQKLIGRIVETEAYLGHHDKASHAFDKVTARNQIMYGPAGFWYVYLIYGIFYCLNIVTQEKGFPSAVLIRALEPIEGIGTMKRLRKKSDFRDLASGPGKLCQALKIDRTLNKTKAFGQNCCLWIEQREKLSDFKIVSGRRIGVDYAGTYWANRQWRFFIKNNQFVSKK
jgi:DNA-3-methyladenine glycosylase